MSTKTFLCIPVLAAGLLGAGALQRGGKDDFKASIEKAAKAGEAKAWGECLRTLRNATQIALANRVDAVRQALPPAPAGMKAHDSNGGDAGLLLARRYETDDGERRLGLKVHADSPPIAALVPMLTNPMVVQASGGEILELGKSKGVLSKQGDDGKSWKLQIVIDQSSLLDIEASGVDREALLKIFDGAAVGRIAKELGN